jgi:4,5:9,10-diseco-3-hydroxy-5,9,17-trioxoandrosta-1(10),2-diene-4-oate hydrolase
MNIPEDRYIQVASVKTRYWMDGEGSPVLLLHGLMNSVEFWLLNFSELAEHHRVYAVDLIGHGKTDKPLSFSYDIDELANFVIRFMDAIEVDRVDLIGHSLGGWITLKIAINHPSYVNKLVLVDSAGLGKKVAIPLRLLSLPGLGEFLGSRTLGVDFPKYLEMQRQSWPDSEKATDEMIRLKYEATRWETVEKSVLKTLRASGNIFGIKESAFQPTLQGLASIENPILVVWGAQDEVVPVAWTQKIADRCPQAHIEIFEDCGHDAMIEKPGMFNQLVLEFLRD